MAEHDSHGSAGPSEDELKASIAAGYEIHDVSLSVLLRWGFGLAVFLVATSAAGMILFVLLQRPPFGPPRLGETFLRRQGVVPPQGTPIIQDNPAGDPRPDNNPRKGVDNIREFRKDEEIRMYEYATQDGNIHIPLDRAMQLGLKDFSAQKPGEAPSGVSPTPGMNLHPNTAEPSATGATGPARTQTAPEGTTGAGGASTGAAAPAPQTRP
jgi:hypothetical protein